MREALTRRLAHLNDGSPSLGEAPDLILLDGGIAQVHAISRVLNERELDIPLFGMVKDDRHKTRSLTDGENDIDIASDDSLYSFIYKLQEEVHRFAVKSVQNAKRKKLRHSALESIPGVGPKKAKLLLSHFGSLQRIAELSEEELSALSGITRADASAVYRYFEKKKGKKET
jgi:excinuclease ABC subunit C